MTVKESVIGSVALCLTLCDPMDCSPSGCSVHGILQARILGWVAILFSRGSSWSRGWTPVLCIAGRFFTIWEIVRRFAKVSKQWLGYVWPLGLQEPASVSQRICMVPLLPQKTVSSLQQAHHILLYFTLFCFKGTMFSPSLIFFN